MLLILGHLRLSSLTITYIRQREHPTSTMEMALGLLKYLRLLSSWLSSFDIHKLGDDVGDIVAEQVGESSLQPTTIGGNGFKF